MPDLPKVSSGIGLSSGFTASEALAPGLRAMDLFKETQEQTRRLEAEQRVVDHGYAHVLYDRLMDQIKQFEADLDPTEEIAAYLSSFGATKFIQIDHVGYHNPYFIVFSGTSLTDRKKVRLVQHTTQLNVLFTSVKLSPGESRPARRIAGFGPDESAAS